MEETKYINTRDYQGGSWYIGVIGSIKEWKEFALFWCDSDDNEELYDYISKQKENEDLLNFINEVWSMEIVKFDKNNKEHIELKESRDF